MAMADGTVCSATLVSTNPYNVLLSLSANGGKRASAGEGGAEKKKRVRKDRPPKAPNQWNNFGLGRLCALTFV